jgi:hypothetical protein
MDRYKQTFDQYDYSFKNGNCKKYENKMKAKIKTLVICLLFTEFCFAKAEHQDSIEFKSNIAIYFLDKQQITTLTYRYVNRSNQPLWLWFDKDDASTLTDNEKIKKYFLTKKNGDDVSFYQIGMDGSVNSFSPNISFSFLKRISPNHSFSVQIISKKEINEKSKQKIDSYINKKILIFTEKKMTSVIPTINGMNEYVFYKEDFIILYLDMLKL